MKRIPTVLLVAIAVELVFHLAMVGIVVVGGDSVRFTERPWLVHSAIQFALTVMYGIGFVDVSCALSGSRRKGAFTAIGACAMLGVLQVLRLCMWATRHSDVVSTIWSVLPTVILVGIAVAAGRARVRLTAPLVVVGIVLGPPRALFELSARWVALRGTPGHLSFEVQTLVAICIEAALIALACRDLVPVVDPARAERGLERAARSLWVRVFATSWMLIALAGHSEHSAGLFQIGIITGAAITAAALLQLAFGALDAARSQVADLPRYPLAVAGALALWAGGAILGELPTLYRTLGAHDGASIGSVDPLATLSVAAPLATLAAVALIGIAIGALARRRGLVDLQAHVSKRVGGFVALTLASVAIGSWLSVNATSPAESTVVVLATTLAGAWAIVLMARLCKLGADAVRAQPAPPLARVERG